MRFLFVVGMLIPVVSNAGVASEFAFTIDFNSTVKDKEYCRPFEELRNKSFKGEPFETWCPAKGNSVFLCSGTEKFHLIKFPDKNSCNEVLGIFKNQKMK